MIIESTIEVHPNAVTPIVAKMIIPANKLIKAVTTPPANPTKNIRRIKKIPQAYVSLPNVAKPFFNSVINWLKGASGLALR